MVLRSHGHAWRQLSLVGIILLSFYLCASCAGLTSLANTLTVLPSWVTRPSVRVGQSAFVGKGEDEDTFNSRLEAMNDILKQISAAIGEDVSAQYYREFSTKDSIADLSLSIVQEYHAGTSTYLMAECSTERLTARRTDVQEALVAEDAKIADLIAQVDVEYRANRDINAIKYGLDALYEASAHNSSYDAADIYHRVLKYIDALRFALVRGNAADASCALKLSRKRWLFSPRVISADVLATFDVRNAKGELIKDNLPCATGEDGTLFFSPSNNSMLESGEVLFTINVQSEMAKLSAVLDETEYQELSRAVEERSITFPYQLVSPYSGKNVLLNMKEYSITGQLLERKDGMMAVMQYLGEKGIKVTIDTDETQDSAELADAVHQKYPKERYLLCGTFGMADQKKVGSQLVTIVSGQAQLWDLQAMEKIGDTEELKAVGLDADDAFSSLSEILLSLLPEFI